MMPCTCTSACSKTQCGQESGWSARAQTKAQLDLRQEDSRSACLINCLQKSSVECKRHKATGKHQITLDTCKQAPLSKVALHHVQRVVVHLHNSPDVGLASCNEASACSLSECLCGLTVALEPLPCRSATFVAEACESDRSILEVDATPYARYFRCNKLSDVPA